MKAYRFIGKDEAELLMKGETLHNETKWSEINDTNSVGFCFFTSRSENLEKVLDRGLEYLDFIASKAYAIVAVEIENMKKGYGYYAAGRMTEYSVKEYSNRNVTGIYTFEENGWDEEYNTIYKFKKIY